MSFPSKKFQIDTPLHLASEAGLGKLIKLFLEHGGNPNSANGREETCLHSICHRGDNSIGRLEIMDELLLWRSVPIECVGDEGNEVLESVSINHVDIDGNAAVHYASMNGLLECVERLISLGAIISIVNKAQKTCCELADGEGHKQLAGMLELALVFQPVDSAMIEFDNSESLYFENQNRFPLLALDCESLEFNDINMVIDELLVDFSELSGESFCRSEALLESSSWDISKLRKEYRKNRTDTYKNAHINILPVIIFDIDPGPWTRDSGLKDPGSLIPDLDNEFSHKFNQNLINSDFNEKNNDININDKINDTNDDNVKVSINNIKSNTNNIGDKENEYDDNKMNKNINNKLLEKIPSNFNDKISSENVPGNNSSEFKEHSSEGLDSESVFFEFRNDVDENKVSGNEKILKINSENSDHSKEEIKFENIYIDINDNLNEKNLNEKNAPIKNKKELKFIPKNIENSKNIENDNFNVKKVEKMISPPSTFLKSNEYYEDDNDYSLKSENEINMELNLNSTEKSNENYHEKSIEKAPQKNEKSNVKSNEKSSNKNEKSNEKLNIFVSSPCSICGDLMLQPVSAYHAVNTQTIIHDRELNKLRNKNNSNNNKMLDFSPSSSSHLGKGKNLGSSFTQIIFLLILLISIFFLFILLIINLFSFSFQRRSVE